MEQFLWKHSVKTWFKLAYWLWCDLSTAFLVCEHLCYRHKVFGSACYAATWQYVRIPRRLGAPLFVISVCGVAGSAHRRNAVTTHIRRCARTHFDHSVCGNFPGYCWRKCAHPFLMKEKNPLVLLKSTEVALWGWKSWILLLLFLTIFFLFPLLPQSSRWPVILSPAGHQAFPTGLHIKQILHLYFHNMLTVLLTRPYRKKGSCKVWIAPLPHLVNGLLSAKRKKNRSDEWNFHRSVEQHWAASSANQHCEGLIGWMNPPPH